MSANSWSQISQNSLSLYTPIIPCQPNEYCHAAAAGVDFVDSMDETQYVTVELGKPMGIVFEENDDDFGGIFVQSL